MCSEGDVYCLPRLAHRLFFLNLRDLAAQKKQASVFLNVVYILYLLFIRSCSASEVLGHELE